MKLRSDLARGVRPRVPHMHGETMRYSSIVATLAAAASCIVPIDTEAQAAPGRDTDPAPAATNPPKLQKVLEAVARGFSRKEVGSVIQTGATVRYRMLVVNFEPTQNSEIDTAINYMKEINWNLDVCENKDVLSIISNDQLTFRITLSLIGQPSIPVADVTAASCAIEASKGSRVSRIIGGIAFAPKPSREEAVAKIHAYIQENFKDPDSALLKCTEVSDAAWIKLMLERRRYGYFIDCDINAKNSYGGYAGYETFSFRMNGQEFERIEQYVDKSGLMEQTK